MINKIASNPRLGTVQLEKLTAKKFNELLIYQAPIILTDEVIVKWDMRKGYNAKLTLSGNRTLRLDQLTKGDYGTIEIIQGSGGNKTLTLPTIPPSKVANDGNGLLVLSTIEQSIDIATFYFNGLTLFWTISLDFT